MSRVISGSWVCILNAATATNSAPTVVTDGVAVPHNARGEFCVVNLRHTTTAGNDARTGTVKLFGWAHKVVDSAGADLSAESWVDMGESYSLASISADGAVTAMVLNAPTVFSRLYAEVTAISGTGTALSVDVAFSEGI